MATMLADAPSSSPLGRGLLTVDEFVALPDSKDFDLVDGVLIERAEMGVLANYVAGQVGTEIAMFCRRTGAGYMLTSDTVYRCFGSDRTGRKPDVSFIAASRIPVTGLDVGYMTIPADLAVEVISTHDLAEELYLKIATYLRHGFREVWAISPVSRTLHLHRRGEPTRTFEEGDTVVGEGALAGFTLAVGALFPVGLERREIVLPED